MNQIFKIAEAIANTAPLDTIRTVSYDRAHRYLSKPIRCIELDTSRSAGDIISRILALKFGDALCHGDERSSDNGKIKPLLDTFDALVLPVQTRLNDGKL